MQQNNTNTQENSESEVQEFVQIKERSPFRKFLVTKIGKILMTLLFGAVMFAVVMTVFFWAFGNENTAVIVIGYIVFIIGGFIGLNNILPNFGIVVSGSVAVVIFTIEIMISFLLGMIIVPLWLGYLISNCIAGLLE